MSNAFKTRYYWYLASDIWAEIRAVILERDNNECVKCGHKKNLNVHHIEYTHPWGTEPIGTLVTLCRDCHLSIEKDKEIDGNENQLLSWYANLAEVGKNRIEVWAEVDKAIYMNAFAFKMREMFDSDIAHKCMAELIKMKYPNHVKDERYQVSIEIEEVEDDYIVWLDVESFEDMKKRIKEWDDNLDEDERAEINAIFPNLHKENQIKEDSNGIRNKVNYREEASY